MNKRNIGTIRTYLMVTHSKILLKARKGVKDLRLSHLQPILLVGENSGLSCTELCKLCDSSRSALYQRLDLCIFRNFIRKDNLKYYLTDTGQQVYNTIVKESDKAIKEITVLLAAQVRKKLE